MTNHKGVVVAFLQLLVLKPMAGTSTCTLEQNRELFG